MLKIIVICSCLFFVASTGCQFHITLFRQLKKEGFHLVVISNLEIVVGSDDCPIWETCTLALVEHLSSSFFVKQSELSTPPLYGCSVYPFDTEDPQNKSISGDIYLYTQLHETVNLIESEIKVPVHLRYHSPKKGGGYAFAELGRPRLLLQCEEAFDAVEKIISAPCPVCLPSNCSWLELPFQTNSANFTIPVAVGDSDHLFIVTFVTYLLAFGGCLYLSLAVLDFNTATATT